MKAARIWQLVMVAIAITAPLSAEAEKVNLPELNGNTSAVSESSSVNWARVAEGARDVAQRTSVSGPSQSTSAAPVPIAQQPGTHQPAQKQSQHEKAEEQLKEQEHQRVLGIFPAFNISYRSDAVSLTGWQKMQLAFHTSIDPVTFGSAFLVAGYREAANDVGFGWGIKGYGQRAGAAYLDAFDSNMIRSGVLPALLHQDPRYFRLGHGSTTHRLSYAIAAAFICRHDNTGKREPNYSSVLGNIATGAISNLYYPRSDTGVGLTITNGMILTVAGAAGAIFKEFWPDISRRLFRNDPTRGRDAQAGTTAAPVAAVVPSTDKP